MHNAILGNDLNPLTPRAFSPKHFLTFLGWIWAKLAPIYLKKAFAAWQHAFWNSYGIAFTHICSGMHRNQNFEILDKKVTYIFRLLFVCFFLFLLAFPFPLFLVILLQWLTFYWACFQLKSSEKASSRWAIFALTFSLKFLSIFMHISGPIEPIIDLDIIGKIFFTCISWI